MKKTERYELRLTKEEKEMLSNKAEEKGTTISALILNSVENNIAVNLDTSDYRELVIQIRRIGNNINNIIKRIHFSNYITDTDLLELETNQEIIERELRKHRLRIKHSKRDLENLTPRKLKHYLEEEEKRIPNYLIYDEITDQLNLQLRSFIQLLNDEKWPDVYPPFVDTFIKYFHPTDYEYDELVNFSNDLSNVLYPITQKTITETGQLTEDDFEDVMLVLDKYRKEDDK